MFTDFCLSKSCLITYLDVFVAFLICCLIIFIYIASYKLNVGFLKISKLDFLRISVLYILSKLPSKWFDWLKWILIISAFSYIEKQNSDFYLMMVIYISYVAIFIDSYNFFYISIITIVYKPMTVVKKIEINADDLKLFPKDHFERLHLWAERHKRMIKICGTIMATASTWIIYNLINYILYIYIK
jgi:hypothetical protein